ncbi:MAG: DUF222 domain-containing protein [Actinomycetota bacterium]
MEFGDAVDAVGVAVDALAAASIDGLDATSLRARLVAMKISESKLTSELARVTHAADSSGAFIGTGARDTAEWLANETGTSTRRNRAVAELGEAMERSDALAEAVRSGVLSSEKAAAAVGAASGTSVDADLLDRIADVPLSGVRPATDEWRAERDAAREADRVAERRGRRFLRLTDSTDGMTRIDGLLDPASAAIVRTSLDAVMNDSAFDGSGRTRDQRCADALTQLAKAASKGDIAGGRSNAKVIVTAPYETVCERAAVPGRSHAGPSVDADAVRAMCCDAGMHRAITGPGSSVLDFGHENRLVSENLFLALVARDQRCRWPGCSIRATWCDAHHLVEWIDHGPTSEANCALLCHYHHSVSHLPGWSITGDAVEFTIHHPDGSTQVSRPPAPVGARSNVSTERSGAPPPPDARPLRADPIGGSPTFAPARPDKQLTLV